MGRNEYKAEDKKPKKSAKKKASKRSNPFSKLSAFFTKIVTNEKLSKIVGLLLLGFCFHLLISLTSYLFTWELDQDLINNHWNNPEVRVENWGSKWGAYFAHQFMFNGFGVASFLFVFLSFILGFRILFKSAILPLGKAFKYSIFSIVWLSISLISYLLLPFSS